MNGNDRVVVGYYSYIGPDGVPYTVNYIADKNGYRASGSHLPVQPGGNGLPQFPSLGGGFSTPAPPIIGVQPLQPTYIPSSTPSPLVISSTPYTPTQSPYSPTQSIYTPSTTIISTPTSYPYTPTTPAPYYTPSSPSPFYTPSSPSPFYTPTTPSPFYTPTTSAPYYPSSTPSPYYTPTTPSAYVPSSSVFPSSTPYPPTGYSSSALITNNPPFPIYTQSTVPFPGYVYTPQAGLSYSQPYNYPSSPGYSYTTPVTRLSFATSPSSLTRSTSANTTPSPNLVLPSSTPAPFVRNYQPSYGLAINNNAPGIISSTPRPFANTVTPLYNTDNNEVVYITPAPKFYNQGTRTLSNLPNNLLLNQEFQPPYVDTPNYYRNNNMYQSVRPLSGPGSASQTITNLSFRNGNAY